MEVGSKKKKKKYTILRISCIAVGAVLAILSAAFIMSTYKPKRYKPVVAPDTGRVSPYLTHHLVPGFYNNIQLDEPFDLVVEEKGFNEVIADGSLFGFQWPVSLNGVTFDAPAAAALPETIMLMGTVDFADWPVVMTIVFKPKLDENGMLYLNLQSVKAGLLDISFLAKKIGSRVFAAQIQATQGLDREWLEKVSAAFLENKPFEPVFDVYERQIRLTKAKIESTKVVLTFVPEE